MTNRDRIDGMSNEELAFFMFNITVICDCRSYLNEEYFIKWLESEAEE